MLPPGSPASDALARVRTEFEAGAYGRSALLADSLYFVSLRDGARTRAATALWWAARGLDEAGRDRRAAERYAEFLSAYPADERVPRGALRLAEVQRRLIDDPAAARALIRHPRALELDEGFTTLRRAARSMSLAELEDLWKALDVSDSGDSGLRALLLAELAVARRWLGHRDSALTLARRALSGAPRGPDSARAHAVLTGTTRTAPDTLRVGVVIPLSGRYGQVGSWLREGMELALDSAARGTSADDAPPVALAFADQASGREMPALIAELARAGVTAVVGPVGPEALAEAAASRGEQGLLLVSPTARRAPERSLAAYTLWSQRQREVEAARLLGRWLAEVGVHRVGALYSDAELGREAYLTFRGHLAGTQAYVIASAPLPPEATTFKGPIFQISSFRPRGVYLAGGRPTSVLQVGPQLSYYGLRGVLVAGGPAWSDPTTVRRLEPSFSQYRVAATFVGPGHEIGAAERFRAMYEKKHRELLSNNQLPSLGYDALRLVLRALEETGLHRPRAVSRAFATLEGVQGATGRLAPVRGAGTVARRVELARIDDRSLGPVRVRDARQWLTGAEALRETRVRGRRRAALRAVAESGIELEGPPLEEETEVGGEAGDAGGGRTLEGRESSRP